MGETTMSRPQIVELLNQALSAEYNSFIGHALASNPYVTAEWEGDLKLLERLRDEENDLTRALLVQFGRYRAGPTVAAFAHWKEDLNFLSLEWLVIRGAAEAKKELARVEAAAAQLPDDAELRATFESIVLTKRRHLAELEIVAAKRVKERDARRAAHRAVTAIKVPGLAAPEAAAAKPAAGGGAPKAPGAPRAPGAPAPKLPGGFKAPSSAPKAPTSAPKAPSPPLPPGAKAPAVPSPPSAPKAPAPPKPSTGAPKLPPGFKKPGS